MSDTATSQGHQMPKEVRDGFWPGNSGQHPQETNTPALQVICVSWQFQAPGVWTVRCHRAQMGPHHLRHPHREALHAYRGAGNLSWAEESFEAGE